MKQTLVLIAAALLMAACGSGEKKAETVAEKPRVLTRTTPAVKDQVTIREQYTSEVQPYRENDITPAAQGVHIDRILVDVGSRVKQGDLLVTLDPTQYTQQLVSLRNIEADYNRLKPVYEAGGISAQQLEQTRTQLEVQREVVANLKRNIELRSPLTGVVTARNNEAGDLFANAPILHVMQIDPLKVMVNISEEYYPVVRKGMPVELVVDLYGEKTFQGKVSLVYPALDPTTRTFTVEVTVPNAKEELRPGMFTRANFNMGEREGVLVPDVAIQKQIGSAERYLYVIKEGVAERRRVVTGRQQGDLVEILSGVEPGEEVAVTALSRLGEGVEVRVENN